jgi:hypothetical protein
MRGEPPSRILGELPGEVNDTGRKLAGIRWLQPRASARTASAAFSPIM